MPKRKKLISNIPTAEEQTPRQEALEQAVRIVEEANCFEWTADRENLVRAIRALAEE